MIIGIGGITFSNGKNDYHCDTMIYNENMTECLHCEKGYYLNSMKECKSLPPNCIVGNESHCIECEYGYYLNLNTRLCTKPKNICKFGNESHCYQCEEGYVKENGNAKE
ncbi:hypothetical protein ENUP19_0113G0034 [Entamoeba nuttalli]|uniref:Tyrosine kinase n=1 Tax=Entamoeba nuttalli TaxID=412467 RepID=A0ABQ0DI58_9EUKA